MQLVDCKLVGLQVGAAVARQCRVCIREDCENDQRHSSEYKGERHHVRPRTLLGRCLDAMTNNAASTATTRSCARGQGALSVAPSRSAEYCPGTSKALCEGSKSCSHGENCDRATCGGRSRR